MDRPRRPGRRSSRGRRRGAHHRHRGRDVLGVLVVGDDELRPAVLEDVRDTV